LGSVYNGITGINFKNPEGRNNILGVRESRKHVWDITESSAYRSFRKSCVMLL
jgi:hypothetical protein